MAELDVAVFPCTLKILPTSVLTSVLNSRDPIVLGVEVLEGVATVGTPVCTEEGVDLGRIASMELDHREVESAGPGQWIVAKIEGRFAAPEADHRLDVGDVLFSRITRGSVEALKEHLGDVMSEEDWRLVLKIIRILRVD